MTNLNTRKEMEAQAERLQRQRKYRTRYNKGDFITDKEVIIINGVQYMRYKAGGANKMRLVREGENTEGLETKTLS